MQRLAPLLLALSSCASPAFLVGAATADITPPVGWRKAGGYHEAISTGVHDPLLAKALVFEQAGERGAIVVCDLTGMGRAESDAARRLASERTGIPAANIVIAATHTHGAPEYHGVLWDVWREATVAKHGSDVHAKGDYVRALVEGCAEAVAKADRTKRAATLERATPKSDLAFNRRFLMKDGSTVTNPGKRNPNIVRAAGPVDDDFPIVLFCDVDEPFASLSVFAMHVAAFGGTTFGADFPGHLQARLRETLGPEFISVFGEGCAGDVNHIDVTSDRPQPGDTEPPRIAALLALSFLTARFEALRPSFAVRSARVRIPLRETTAAEVERAREVLSLKIKADFLGLVAAYRDLWTERLRARDGAAADEEIQAFRLGDDLAVVTLPHEVFVELGMDIERRSPFRNTLVVTLANDVDFYVPTRKAFGEGGYEVTTSPYLPGGGELLADAAVRLLLDLHR